VCELSKVLESTKLKQSVVLRCLWQMEVGLNARCLGKLCQKLCCAQHTNVLFNVRPVASCEFILVRFGSFGGLGCTIILTITTWMQCLCSIIVETDPKPQRTVAGHSQNSRRTLPLPWYLQSVGCSSLIDIFIMHIQWNKLWTFTPTIQLSFASFLPYPLSHSRSFFCFHNNKFPICLWHWP